MNDEQAVGPALRVSYSLIPLPAEWGTADEQAGLAFVDRVTDGATESVVCVGFTLRPVTAWDRVDPGAGGSCDRVLAFEVPRIHSRSDGHLIDLRVVAGLMAQFSRKRVLLVTMVAEPFGWQSLKLSRREVQVPPIVRHWGRLGFQPLFEAYSCQAAHVFRVARDYRVPAELATWGPRFERATRREVEPVEWAEAWKGDESAASDPATL